MKIIIVDDELYTREDLLKKILQVDRDAQVEMFSDSRGVLGYIENNDVNIAFLDIEMPGVTGIELAKSIKCIKKEVHIVFVTAYDEYAMEAIRLRAGGYVLKPASVDDIRNEIDYAYDISPFIKQDNNVNVQCFGGFDIFVNSEKVHFNRSKSKELLALLVDKRGSEVSNSELANVLFEDKVYDNATKSYIRKIISDLVRVLKENNIENMVIRNHNSICVDVKAFECDYYNYIKGDVHAINAYKEDYMPGYSWAEETNGYLQMN